MQNRLMPWYLFLGWAIVVVLGFRPLLSYEIQPGHTGTPHRHWPQDSTLERSGGMTLVMFVHPQCSCSRASLGQLDRLIAITQDQNLHCTVAFEQPADQSADRSKSELWGRASSLSG